MVDALRIQRWYTPGFFLLQGLMGQAPLKDENPLVCESGNGAGVMLDSPQMDLKLRSGRFAG